MVNIPPDVTILSISSGGWHSAFLSNQNECYIWGWNLNGQVSMSDEDESVFVVKPTKLIILDDMSGREVKFETISLGSRHSSALDINGNVYMFGWNKYGQLFNDHDQSLSLNQDEDEFNVEIPVKIEKTSRIKSIKCGCWLTATITDWYARTTTNFIIFYYFIYICIRFFLIFNKLVANGYWNYLILFFSLFYFDFD